MTDRAVSTTTVASGLLWFLGGALIVVGALWELWVVGAGLYLAGGGGILAVRRMLSRAEAERRDVFELGRDVGRDRQHMRSL